MHIHNCNSNILQIFCHGRSMSVIYHNGAEQALTTKSFHKHFNNGMGGIKIHAHPWTLRQKKNEIATSTEQLI